MQKARKSSSNHDDIYEASDNENDDTLQSDEVVDSACEDSDDALITDIMEELVDKLTVAQDAEARFAMTKVSPFLYRLTRLS